MESDKPAVDYSFRKHDEKVSYKAWVLLEGRTGDDKQLLDLVNLLEWELIPIALNTSIWELIAHRLFGTRLFLKKIIENQFPRPDAIFTIGGRNAAIAYAIKKNSGNKIKLYVLGRPFAPFSWFDLIITTPQYCLPKSSKTIELPLPVSTPNIELDKLERWKSVIQKTNKSKICVLLGGNNSNYHFSPTFTENLCKSLTDYARRKNASLLITNSSRTPREATSKLKKELGQNHIFYDVNDNSISNPYWMFIDSSQEVLVTSDSVSMIADACKSDKFVRIIALPSTFWNKLIEKLRQAKFIQSHKIIQSFLSFLIKRGVWTPPRNIKNLHDQLVEKKIVGWFDSNLPENSIKTVKNTYNYSNLIAELNRNIKNKINDN